MFDEEHVIYRYKYLPFSNDAKKTLTESTIKFTCPLEFNDPFDCSPFYDLTNIDRVTKLRPDLWKAAGDRKGLSPAKRLQDRLKYVARLKKRIEDGSFKRDSVSRVGVVSLSKNALSIPMWSHYADEHRGFLLEFRIPVLGFREDIQLSTDRLLPLPVDYSAKRPFIEIGTELNDDILKQTVLTKSLDWVYEEEERVIDNDRGPGIYKYRRDEILCSVIAGVKMEPGYYEELKAIVEDLRSSTIPNLTLYQVNSREDEYTLEVRGHPRLAASE